MTIILPHEVLFRGDEEGNIQTNLIEQNHINTIIGLPSNIFFDTGIPTIIIVLKQQRKNTNILIINTGKIDTDFMNSRFNQYLKILIQGNLEEINDKLNELHKSFVKLSQEE